MFCPAFPINMDYRRACEILITANSSLVGALFITVPETLSSNIYDPIGGAAMAPVLGITLMIVAFLHSVALWLNGHRRKPSRSVRTIACFLHFILMSFFAYGFVSSGAFWGALSMLMVLVMIYFALHRAFNP